MHKSRYFSVLALVTLSGALVACGGPVSGRAPDGVSAALSAAGYAGCYTDSSTRALPTQLAQSNATVETCVAAAKAKNFAYAGLQYRGECWAGNTLGYKLVSDSDCNMKCSADSSEMCGGSWRNSVYSAAAVPAPAPVASYVGCYTDSSTRALPTQLAWSNATVETCVAAAKAKNLAYAGLQYSGECWAGNTLGYDLVSDSDCNMKCSASSSETCGGSWRNSVYSTAGTTTVAVAVTPKTSSITVGMTAQLTATVTGSTDKAVTWSVQEGTAGGSVTSAGLYTAPQTAGTYHVIAKSHADPTKSDTATVTSSTSPPAPAPAPAPAVVAVSVSPTTVDVDACQTYTFTASVTGTSNTAVTWSTLEGTTGGTISTTGVYTAPATAGTYHVVATSQADTTKTTTATVTVTERIVSVAVNPQTVTVSQGGTAQFSATVTTTCGAFTVTN